MTLIEGRTHPFYGCVRWPKCRGSHSCHKDGRPMGRPANHATRIARMRVHRVFDRLWQPGPDRVMTRPTAYKWFATIMQLDTDEAHIGNLSLAQCQALIAHVETFRLKTEEIHADPIQA